jgi:hypothetical protein
MQRLVFFFFLLGSIVILALHTAAGAQHQPILPLPTDCLSNAPTMCASDQPATNAILICLVAEGPKNDGCASSAFIVEIAHHSKAWPKR